MKYHIRKAAVIGSGTMGGGIAALFAGLGIPTLLLDIVPFKLTAAEEAEGKTLDDASVRNRIIEAGWKAVTKSRPPAVLSETSKQLISLGNLDDDFDQLADVDLIVEVIIENLDIKRDLFERIDAIRAEHTIIATNTSGLPIQALAEGRSKGFQGHFLVINQRIKGHARRGFTDRQRGVRLVYCETYGRYVYGYISVGITNNVHAGSRIDLAESCVRAVGGEISRLSTVSIVESHNVFNLLVAVDTAEGVDTRCSLAVAVQLRAGTQCRMRSE